MLYNPDVLEAAVKKQQHTSFYDVHLYLPLTDTEAQPAGTYSKQSTQATTISVRLPNDIKEELEKIGAESGYSLNQLIRNAVAYALKLQRDREEAHNIHWSQLKNTPPMNKQNG